MARGCPTPRGLARLAVLSVLLAGCGRLPGQPAPEDKFERPEEVTSFAKLFAKNCAGCHGKDGRLGPAPPLNDPLFRALVPEKELLKVITEGRPGTPMPAFARDHGGTLTPKQVEILALGIKSHWGKAEAPKDAPPYLATGLPTGNAEAGKKVFARACSMCHGDQGDADGMRINDPAFLTLISDQALRRLAITGRPDLGMPSYADATGRDAGFRPLTSDEIQDLVALLASWRQGTTSKK